MDEKLWISFAPTAAHLEAIGQVVVQWAYFEVQFDGLLEFLRLHPDALSLIATQPSAFSKRAALLRQSAEICFPNCEALKQRFVKIADTAMQLRRKRDHIAHGTWFVQARRRQTEKIGAILYRRGETNSAIFKVETIQKIAIDISYQSRHLVAIIRWFPRDNLINLTVDEVSALQKFRLDYLPSLPKPSTDNRYDMRFP